MHDLNFFSPYIEVKKTSRKKQFYGIISVISVLIVIGSIFAVNEMQIRNLEKELKMIQHNLQSEKIAEQIKDIEEQKRKLTLMKTYYDALYEVNEKIGYINVINKDLLTSITEQIPPSITFQLMAFSWEELQVQGEADSRIAIAELEHNFKNIKAFRQVHVVNISKSTEGSNHYEFTLKCRLKGEKE
ncbi:PilN domain-containing protein [Clostridiaceae bacterium 35-E11]